MKNAYQSKYIRLQLLEFKLLTYNENGKPNKG